MRHLILLNLTTSKLVTHPLPSGQQGVICFDSPEEVEQFTAQQTQTQLFKTIKVTQKELKSIPNRIGW